MEDDGTVATLVVSPVLSGREYHWADSFQRVVQRQKSSDEAILRQGWLEKRPVSTSLSSQWKRRWITLVRDAIQWSDSEPGERRSMSGGA
eukprot:4502695-Prymnesium_polylepis.1